jgi:hypothetical protein
LAEIADKENEDLPDTISLTQEQVDQYFPIWVRWHADEKRHLPSSIAAEPAEPFDAILEIEAYFQKITEPQKTPDTYHAE